MAIVDYNHDNREVLQSGQAQGRQDRQSGLRALPGGAKASNPKIGTPVQTLRLSFPLSDKASGRPKSLSSRDMTFSKLILGQSYKDKFGSD